LKGAFGVVRKKGSSAGKGRGTREKKPKIEIGGCTFSRAYASGGSIKRKTDLSALLP